MLGLVIAVVVIAASVDDNAAGIALLDKVAADTETVEKALVDQGFKNAVVAHGEKLGIEVEIVERNPKQTGFVPQARAPGRGNAPARPNPSRFVHPRHATGTR